MRKGILIYPVLCTAVIMGFLLTSFTSSLSQPLPEQEPTDSPLFDVSLQKVIRELDLKAQATDADPMHQANGTYTSDPGIWPECQFLYTTDPNIWPECPGGYTSDPNVWPECQTASQDDLLLMIVPSIAGAAK